MIPLRPNLLILEHPENVRLYTDIIMKEKKNRAMIEIKFLKKQNDEDKGKANRNVEIETVSDYIFSQMKVDPNEIQENRERQLVHFGFCTISLVLVTGFGASDRQL